MPSSPRPSKPSVRHRITFGYNKDHRPDLKQLLFSITISADGAVPVHCKIFDGNTPDDHVHKDTWDFLRQLCGTADFLYVADSKLCSRDNMGHIASNNGRFLTVMPRTRAEDGSFREHIQGNAVAWREVHREANPRRRDGPDVVYQGVEGPRRGVEGHRVLWYKSSRKAELDAQSRQRRLDKAYARLEELHGRKRPFQEHAKALSAGQRILEEEEVERWLRVEVHSKKEEEHKQVGSGRPGPGTRYRLVEHWHFKPAFVEDALALKREALCDGLFPLMTNDEGLSLEEALLKYKYQPFVEKRHEQLKTGFCVMPMWLKNVGRVDSLLWLYFVVELVQALLEREVRRRMKQEGHRSLALYPERRPSAAPTTAVVFAALEGHRRYRLLDEHGQELQRFHDPVSPAARDVLALLDLDPSAFGID